MCRGKEGNVFLSASLTSSYTVLRAHLCVQIPHRGGDYVKLKAKACLHSRAAAHPGSYQVIQRALIHSFNNSLFSEILMLRGAVKAPEAVCGGMCGVRNMVALGSGGG